MSPFWIVFLCGNMELRRKDDVLPESFDSAADDFFVVAPVELFPAIRFSGIEEGTAVVMCCADGSDAVRCFRHFPIAVGESHAPHPYFRDGQISDFSFLHVSS